VESMSLPMRPRLQMGLTIVSCSSWSPVTWPDLDHADHRSCRAFRRCRSSGSHRAGNGR
jgi:hypothetical protein